MLALFLHGLYCAVQYLVDNSLVPMLRVLVLYSTAYSTVLVLYSRAWGLPPTEVAVLVLVLPYEYITAQNEYGTSSPILFST